MPKASAARAARISPSACCMPVRPVGAIATGIATSMPIIFVAERAVLHVDRDALAQLDLLEVGLVGAVGALGPRAGVGVVVEHARHGRLASTRRSSMLVMTGVDAMRRCYVPGAAPPPRTDPHPGRCRAPQPAGRRRREERQARLASRAPRRPRRARLLGAYGFSRSLTLRSAEARTPSRRRRRPRSTRFRHWPAARRISRPSRVCAGRVRARVTVRKSSKRSLMPIVFAGVALARQVAGELACTAR